MIIQNNTNSSKNSNRNSNDNKRNNHMKSTNVNTMEKKKQMLIMVNIFEYMLINIHHKWPILIYQLLMDILATINQY